METIEYVVRTKFRGQFEDHVFKSKEEVYDFLASLPKKTHRWFTRVNVFKRVY